VKLFNLAFMAALLLLLGASKCDDTCTKCKAGLGDPRVCEILYQSGVCEPAPTPTPEPTPTPTPEPTPTPTPPTACPKPLAPGAYVYLNDKAAGHGFDSTPRVHGDPEFCRLVHGVAVNDCHLEGWSQQVACELELVGGCPRWEFTKDKQVVAQCRDNHDAVASCDHFGTQPNQDDPQTPTTGTTIETLRGFEGRPLECGLQRDSFGPYAGFFTIAHGEGYVRACAPNDLASLRCGPWRNFSH
jgi:hypothetical protein